MKLTAHNLTAPSKESKEEVRGRWLAGIAITIIGMLVAVMLLFLTFQGLALFIDNKVNVIDFITGTDWDPGHGHFGALPMIATSLTITFVAGLISLPLALMVALAITEILPNGVRKFIQPLIELLVGIPSVIYGFVGLTVIVPFLRSLFGGTGFGMAAAVIVLFAMIMPTMISMTIDTLEAVPNTYRMGSAGLGATRWQTIAKIIIPSAKSGILTAMIFGMTRAFGEALAVQMVIGNTAMMPGNFMQSAATLTSVLTTGIGNTIMGTAANNALWSLALILLIMSLIFNILIHLAQRKGR
ncbi:phosphate ABC transporter permease subunit PstC [Limosilactobacillus equigenerosi]|uniref:Phosphate transport system permease protein n=1 Tax=Limosilactobacillus equigenerosi DSM 18793 = JCM 14505 TaxID=1423742 RepID=A0A0R1UT60_9LACO|nr:phosphate ABC transporter permease subunit PstC [Limosilactobacillus equigenerosi]KRL96353.1 phosphate ABC transporter permease [Limosilactobacillus equigenerosi DSM 18793 = JCM 14505]